MVQVEAIYRAPVDDRGIVKTCKCRNRSNPFFNGVMQQWLAAELCKFVRQLLSGCCSFKDDAHFVGKIIGDRLKAAHHGVDTVGMKDEAV